MPEMKVYQIFFVKFLYFVPALSLPSSSLPPIILLPEPPASAHDSEDSDHPCNDSATEHTGREDGEICRGRSRSGIVWT